MNNKWCRNKLIASSFTEKQTTTELILQPVLSVTILKILFPYCRCVIGIMLFPLLHIPFNRIWVDCVIGINSSRKPYTWQVQEGGFKPLFQGFFCLSLNAKRCAGHEVGKITLFIFCIIPRRLSLTK